MSKATSAPKNIAKTSVNPVSLLKIFNTLKGILSKHVPPLAVLSSTADRYELMTPKPFHHGGVPKDNAYCGAVMVKKDFVGLYLMFIYDEPKNIEKLGPDLRKTLKGKSCFNIKKLDETLIKQIETALKDSINYYKKEGAI